MHHYFVYSLQLYYILIGKVQEKFSDDKDASTLFNATEEDFEYAGLEKPSDKAGVSLHKAAEKKGGSLSMEDLMELSGIPKK